jgi:2-polyprenyl-6-methoxyphenol hydroxylase-like FAD-dependent oxidoreductase
MSSPSNVIDSDVVIIGMGPVGKMAALLLARAGHSVTILERKDATYALPRAVAHDAEIARVLQHAGMPVDSMPDAVEPYDDMYVWVNADDDVLHQVDWTGIDPSGWNNTYFYNQPALERHLDEKLQNLPRVDIRRGVDARVTGQGSGGVEI